MTLDRGRSASTDDFIALASKVAGRDLKPFLTGWLHGTTSPPMPGHPDWTTIPAGPAAAATGKAVPGPAFLDDRVDIKPGLVLHSTLEASASVRYRFGAEIRLQAVS